MASLSYLNCVNSQKDSKPKELPLDVFEQKLADSFEKIQKQETINEK